MKLRQLIVAVFAILLVVGSVQAAEPQVLTLKEAINRGLEQNHQVKAAYFQAEAARAAANGASYHYMPSLTFEETWSRSNVPVNTFMMKLNQGRFDSNNDMPGINNPASISDFKTSLTLEQPILAPAAWSGRKIAQYGAEQQQAGADLIRQQAAFNIFQGYLEIQKARAYLVYAEKALEEARESRRQAGLRTAAGLGLKSDELRSATHLAAMEQQKISIANNLTLARMQLALLTGGKPGEEVDVEQAVQIKLSAKTVDELIAFAQQERRDIKAAERGKEKADSAAQQARSGYLPTVGAVASWQMNDNNTPLGKDHDAWMAGISLKWNIFDGFRTWNGNSQARAARAAAFEQLEQTRKDAGYQVHEAWLRRQEAEKRREVAVAVVKSAEETVRLLAKRFENSLATMVELLDAQSALNQARANLVDSESSLMLSTGRIYHAAGIFLKEIQ